MRLAPSKMSSESSILPRGWNEKMNPEHRILDKRTTRIWESVGFAVGKAMWWVHREIAKSAAKTL